MNAPVDQMRGYWLDRAFVHGLRDVGLEEGRNIVIERRSAEGRYERLPQLLGDVIATRVDVIVTIGPGVREARRATQSIPIVAVATDSLIESGAVVSLARPGKNVTGLTGEVDLLETGTKRFQLIRQAAPGASRVAVLGYALKALETSRDSYFESATRALGQTIVWIHARTARDVQPALASIEKERVSALYVEGQPANFLHIRDITQFAASRGLPSMYEFREGPENGGLMSYAANIADLFRRAGTYVDRILKGAKPGDLPVEQPTKFELVVNRDTAQRLGITLPQSLQQRVDEWVSA